MIHPGDSKRIDPDEPWRYACPDCGGTNLEKNVRVGPYCHDCTERKTFVVDKKTDAQVIDP